MNKSNMIKTLPLLIGATFLASCGGGNNSTNTGSSNGGSGINSHKEVILSDSSQLRTPASINTTYAMSSSAVEQTATGNKATAAAVQNSCLALVPQANGKNYAITINSAPWWSTANISFSIKNTCSTAIAFTNLPVTVSSVLLNGSTPTNLDEISQSGPMWMTVGKSISGNNLLASISTPTCEGAYCSWAMYPAGGITTFSMGSSLSGPINSLTVGNVTLDGSPVPPVPTTGTLNITATAATNLQALCKTTTCAIKVNVTDPNGALLATPIILDPAKESSSTVSYKNALPGNYTMVADSATLPAGVTPSYTPTAAIAVNANAQSNGQTNFTYTEPAQLGSLQLNLTNVSDTNNFSTIKQINGTATDVANPSQVYTFTVDLGKSYTLTGLAAKHKYNIYLQGIGNAQKNSYYAPIGLNDQLVTANTTTPVKLTYTAVAATKLQTTKFVVTGDTVASQSVQFADGKYKYATDNTIVNNSSYSFIKDSTTVINTTAPNGYSVKLNPVAVTSGTSSVNFTYSKVITPTATNIVSVYLLIDNPAQLQQYVNDLNSVPKVNFNRVIFSFVRPTLTNYTSGNLAHTGILGYFKGVNGAGQANGADDFAALKNAVALSKAKGIQAFLSVGGWNYSCNPAFYSNCGATDANYDWFPDPTIPSEAATAATSYNNLIKLTNDLGMDGIDLDAEEFWHADKYAVTWNGDPWATSIATNIQNNGGPTYANLIKYGADTTIVSTRKPALMPKTVEKLDAIINALENNPATGTLMFATAAPPVGARPITGFVYGDTSPNIYDKGGVWWLGNLKGLWYSLMDKDPAAVNRFNSIGLMTYDLCSGRGVDNSQMCAPYGNADLDLASQVSAYMKDYNTWLKAPTPRVASISVKANSGEVAYLPAKFNAKPIIQFGFEVNDPAYPTDAVGKLQLTDSLVTTILQQRATDSNGVIIWQMYSVQNTAAKGTTSKYTMNQSCATFLANDSRYDCNANFPSPAK